MYQGHYYEQRVEPLSYADAIQFASSLHYQGAQGHLVTITTLGESTFITNLQWTGWVGISSLWIPGVFVYFSGPEIYTPPRIDNWAPGEPSSVMTKLCVEQESDGWHNSDCGVATTFIVEYECPPGQEFGLSGCTGM
jgi:hypothetical protein